MMVTSLTLTNIAHKHHAHMYPAIMSKNHHHQGRIACFLHNIPRSLNLMFSDRWDPSGSGSGKTIKGPYARWASPLTDHQPVHVIAHTFWPTRYLLQSHLHSSFKTIAALTSGEKTCFRCLEMRWSFHGVAPDSCYRCCCHG